MLSILHSYTHEKYAQPPWERLFKKFPQVWKQHISCQTTPLFTVVQEPTLYIIMNYCPPIEICSFSIVCVVYDKERVVTIGLSGVGLPLQRIDYASICFPVIPSSTDPVTWILHFHWGCKGCMELFLGWFIQNIVSFTERRVAAHVLRTWALRNLMKADFTALNVSY